MVVSTRSKTTQTHIEEFGTKPPRGRKAGTTKDPKDITQKKESGTNKRKASVSTSGKPAKQKKTSQPKKESNSTQAEDSSTILINRAPVLQLWSACVTHRLYPSLPWSTCISAGSAISTICAVAKGRSIGTISEKDDSEEKNRKRKEAKKKQADLDEIHVMQFNLKLKDGLAIVGSEQKGKPANEDALKKKFGEAQYDRTRRRFEEALKSWDEDEEEKLNKEAFRFYEEFRPAVKSGQKGWGRKGELDLETVRSVVQKQ